METLFTIRGRVLGFRRDADPLLVNRWINDRIRQILDAKLYWSTMVDSGVISVKSGWRQGSVSLSPGSALVSGQGTNWPVDDEVNTFLDAPVEAVGYVESSVAHFERIRPGMWLTVGSGDPEAVPVVELTPRGFIAKYHLEHPAGDPVRASSLAGLQFRLSVSSPVYEVRAVISPTLLMLNKPWAGGAVSASPYEILHLYATMPHDLKTVLYAVDPVQPMPLEVGASFKHIALLDPQRSTSGWTRALVEAGPDETGVMRYEMWPAPAEGRQIYYLYAKYWPELVADNDPAPWFIDPQVIADGAIADALNWKRSADDPYHNPRLGQYYEARFQAGVERLKAQDEARIVKEYESLPKLAGMSADWYRTHATDETGIWMPYG